MKKALVLFAIMITSMMLSCENSTTTTYSIEDFYSALDVIHTAPGYTNVYEDGIVSWQFYSYHIVALAANEYLGMTQYSFPSSPGIHENTELYEYLGLEPSEEFIYIISTYSDGNTHIRIPTEAELIQIYVDYLLEYAPPITTATTTCTCG